MALLHSLNPTPTLPKSDKGDVPRKPNEHLSDLGRVPAGRVGLSDADAFEDLVKEMMITSHFFG